MVQECEVATIQIVNDTQNASGGQLSVYLSFYHNNAETRNNGTQYFYVEFIYINIIFNNLNIRILSRNQNSCVIRGRVGVN